MEVNNMIKLKKLLNEQKPFNLSYEEAKVKYLSSCSDNAALEILSFDCLQSK